MDYSKLCPGCMKELTDEQLKEPCPYCGYQHVEAEGGTHALKPYTILNGKYLVGRVIGEGGFGITYLGYDLNLQIRLAIKEYYPSGYASRETTVSNSVTSFTGDNAKIFADWKEKFIREARMLAKFNNLNGIVEVRDFFNENNTAYIVMEYLEGRTLKQYLKDCGGRIEPEELFELVKPVIHSLEKVHNEGLIHRDISPDNLMLLADHTLKLLDFGAARSYTETGEKSLSVLLKPGYAPEEQYRTHGNQGPWTDVYAMCATIYKCLTGDTPVESLERMVGDTLVAPSQKGVKLDPSKENTLMDGLKVNALDRIQSMDELYRCMYEGDKLVEKQPVQSTMYQQPVQPTQYQQPVPPVQSTMYQQPAQPIQQAQYQQPVQSTQYQQPVQLVQSTQYQQPLPPVQPTQYQQQFTQPTTMSGTYPSTVMPQINLQQPETKKSGKKKFVFLGIAGVALIGVVIAVVLFLTGGKKNLAICLSDSVLSLEEGESTYLTVTNINQLDPVGMEYHSDNEQVVMVEEDTNGRIYVIAGTSGEAKITVRDADGHESVCNVTVASTPHDSSDMIIMNGNQAIIAGYTGIYRGILSSDGTLSGKEKITDYIADSMCLVGDTIYFVNGSMIGSLNLNGSSRVKSICDFEYSSSFGAGFYYNNGYIYLHDADYKLCRVDVQSGYKENLTTQTITDFVMVGEQIYYYSENSEEILKINLDGSNPTVVYNVSSLTAGTLMRLEYYNGILYFTCMIIQDEDNGTGIVSVYQYDIASDTSLLLNSEDGGRIDSRNLQIDDDYIYISEENATTIAKLNLSTGKKNAIYNGDFYVFVLDGDYLYTWDYVTGDDKRMQIQMIRKDNGSYNQLSTIE